MKDDADEAWVVEVDVGEEDCKEERVRNVLSAWLASAYARGSRSGLSLAGQPKTLAGDEVRFASRFDDDGIYLDFAPPGSNLQRTSFGRISSSLLNAVEMVQKMTEREWSWHSGLPRPLVSFVRRQDLDCLRQEARARDATHEHAATDQSRTPSLQSSNLAYQP